MAELLCGFTSCATCGRCFDRISSQARWDALGQLVCRRPCGPAPIELELRADRQGIVRYRPLRSKTA